MDCYVCVEKAARVTHNLLEQQPDRTRLVKATTGPVLDHVTGDKRTASPSGSPAAKPKRQKIAPLTEQEVEAEQSLGLGIGDSEHENEITKPDQSMELAKSSTHPLAPTPDIATSNMEREEKIQRLAEIRARAAHDAEVVWARAKAEIAEIRRREQKEKEELV